MKRVATSLPLRMANHEPLQPLPFRFDVSAGQQPPSSCPSPMRSRCRLICIVAGMFAAYVGHDYVQELVFTYPSFKFGWFMSLVELSLISLASFLQMRFSLGVGLGERPAQQPASLAPSATEAKCAAALAAFIAVTMVRPRTPLFQTVTWL
jgi:hypothetical protein